MQNNHHPSRRPYAPRLNALLAAALLSLTALGAAAADSKTPADTTAPAGDGPGWYSADQAKRGHGLYNTYCAQCHRPELTGALGPALIGDTFEKRWSGSTLGQFYQFEHENMPANNPGAVPEDQLTAITAYILSKNGFPAGDQPFAPDRHSDRKLSFGQ